jgi:hypothetical protein
MSRQAGFIHRSANGLHSSICLACYRTAGRSPHSPALAIYEMVHECSPSDLSNQPTTSLLDRALGQINDAAALSADLSPTLELPSHATFQSNPSA